MIGSTIPKWMQRMIDLGVPQAVIEQRAERRRIKEREWAQRNRDIKAAHKRAYTARKKSNTITSTTNVVNSGGVASTATTMKILCTYRPNWKEAPVYQCTELNYRGKQTS